jgi:hypothetical protein
LQLGNDDNSIEMKIRQLASPDAAWFACVVAVAEFPAKSRSRNSTNEMVNLSFSKSSNKLKQNKILNG